jgi:hypothetical protein
MFKKIVKDKNLRKRYNSFEIWNKLNKSFKKSLMFYNIPKISYKGKKNIVKVLYVIIVLRQVEVQE